ncbi:hypothetical protein ACFSC3_06495 [Sphingomonas floccifaciens]|uniref:Uncharacterized protein n=1 Tax=Sphingomonas floccifaciens TaxID=1844115 RepID=A0ABW4NCD7_9SPHN
MPAVTETELAAMPRIADATLAAAFHWPATEEERLYRDCPTAFWLAPDADDLLPEPPLAPMPQTEPQHSATPEMTATGTTGAIGLAVAVAGPVFVAALSLVVQSPSTPIERIAGGLALALVSFPLTIPVGGLAALLPVILGVTTLAWLGSERPLARRGSLWAATGTGMGLAIAALFDAGMVTIPLVLTSIACATVAHRAIDWVEPEFA